jgi:hypothetical protein
MERTQMEAIASCTGSGTLDLFEVPKSAEPVTWRFTNDESAESAPYLGNWAWIGNSSEFIRGAPAFLLVSTFAIPCIVPLIGWLGVCFAIPASR